VHVNGNSCLRGKTTFFRVPDGIINEGIPLRQESLKITDIQTEAVQLITKAKGFLCPLIKQKNGSQKKAI
jgi:hypothetical protein